MNCPRCGLYNLDSALRCDCGYSFETKAVDGPPSPKWSRQRGGCLATYLVLCVIGYLYLLFYLGGVWLGNWNALAAQPQVAAIWAVSVLSLSIFFLLAVWKWKRWGVYGYCTTYVLSWLGSAVTGGLSFDLVRDVCISAVQLLVFLFLVRRAWGLFDPWRRSTLPPNRMRVPEHGMMPAAEVTGRIDEAAPATQPSAEALGCLAIFLASNVHEANFIIRTFRLFLDWIPSITHRLIGSFSGAIGAFAKRHRLSFLHSVLGAVGSGLGVMPLGWIASGPILVVFGNIDTIEAAGWIFFFLMVALPFTLGPVAGLLAGVIGRALIRRYPSTRLIKAIAAPPGLRSGFMAGLLVGVLVSVVSSVMLCTQFPAEDAFLKGNANFEKGSLDQAIADYTRAIERDSRHVTAYNNRALAYFNRGLVYAEQGKLDQAIADFTRTTELVPKFVDAYNSRGYAYMAKGDPDKALADFDKALEIDPQNANVHDSRCEFYLNQNKLDQAMTDCIKAIEFDPKQDYTYKKRGLVYQKKGLKAEAVADFMRYLELKPNAPDRTEIEQFIRELSATPDAPVCVLVDDGATNIAKGRSVKASDAPMTQYPASAAVDGSSRTWWGAGRFAPAWIEIDLGCTTNIVRVALLTSQTPSGNTVHRVLGRGEYEDWRLLHQFEKWTADSETLGARAQQPWLTIRYLRIETVTSPSWVGWREIEVYPLAN